MKKAFVIGHPVAHSKSPLIHGTWIARYGVEGSYEAVDVAPEALPEFIGRVRAGEFVGGNVTIPHKEAVMSLLDRLDPLAGKIGAVNTISRAEDGTLYGTNTDYIGFLANLDAGAPEWDAGLEQAIILGAGGAARAILAGLADRGVQTIHLLNRTQDRAAALAKIFGPCVVPAGLDRFDALAPGSGLVVNTTSVGMGGTRFNSLALDRLQSGAVVTDIVYTPLTTPLLADAQAQGFATVDGLGMLLHQAVPGFSSWFGVRPEVTDGLRARVSGQ